MTIYRYISLKKKRYYDLSYSHPLNSELSANILQEREEVKKLNATSTGKTNWRYSRSASEVLEGLQPCKWTLDPLEAHTLFDSEDEAIAAKTEGQIVISLYHSIFKQEKLGRKNNRRPKLPEHLKLTAKYALHLPPEFYAIFKDEVDQLARLNTKNKKADLFRHYLLEGVKFRGELDPPKEWVNKRGALEASIRLNAADKREFESYRRWYQAETVILLTQRMIYTGKMKGSPYLASSEEQPEATPEE